MIVYEVYGVKMEWDPLQPTILRIFTNGPKVLDLSEIEAVENHIGDMRRRVSYAVKDGG